ncbi:MAG TPA: hypothetical protein DEP53_04520 [Bacteroidetes bacterium]|nr:hypothetical protein [Bacteroidota bacterium]
MTQPNRTAQLLESISRTSIGIIGDFCLDAYWELDRGTPELSLETGKPTLAVTHQRYSPGGAGNVAHNLLALGARRVAVFGIVGNDLFGMELQRQMAGLGAANSLTVQSTDWQTPVYAKPHIGAEEQNRIDFGRFNVLSIDSERALIRQISQEIKSLDGLVVNQQLPRSIFTTVVIEALNTLAERWPDKIFLVDARHRIPDFHSMICKLNAVEAARLFGKHIRDNESATDQELGHFAEQIFERTGKPVLITRSRRGILLFDGTRATQIHAAEIVEPTDPVGAGDTVVAALAASLSARSSLRESAELATLAATVTVKKLRQTGTATPGEILALAATSTLAG